MKLFSPSEVYKIVLTSLRQREKDGLTNSSISRDHDVHFYSSVKGKYQVFLSHLKTGLDSGCFALCIVSGDSIGQIQVAMETFGLNIEPETVKLVTSQQWCTPEGEFHADRVVEQYRRLIDASLSRGFRGLSVSADVADTFDYLSHNGMVKDWLIYEQSFGRTCKLPMNAMCAYRTDQVDSRSHALLQLIHAHKNTIPPTSLNVLDNKELYLNALTETLSNILGEKATEVIFRYLTKNLEGNSSQIPDEIQGVDNALESLLGEASSKIQQLVIQNIHQTIGLNISRTTDS